MFTEGRSPFGQMISHQGNKLSRIYIPLSFISGVHRPFFRASDLLELIL
jgi:hypothetical protein